MFVATSYDYDAPLDEYGIHSFIICVSTLFISRRLYVHKIFLTMFMMDCVLGLAREPKYGHLKLMHSAIKQAEAALVSADPKVWSLGKNSEVDLT